MDKKNQQRKFNHLWKTGDKTGRETNISRATKPGLRRKLIVSSALLATCFPVVSTGVEHKTTSINTSAAESLIRFDIPAQDLTQALSTFSAQSRVQVLYEGNIAEGLNSTPLKGSYEPDDALRLLLSETPLQARFIDARSVTLERKRHSDMDELMKLVANDDWMVEGTAEPEEEPYTGPVEQMDLTVRGGEWSGYNALNASTATKTDTPILDIPASISVITRQQIEDRQAWTTEEALKYTVGVNSPGPGSRTPFDQAFIIRGFNTATTTTGGDYYRDGFRMIGIPISMANLERIELLRGPASVLYGQSQPGGLINVVTKKPLSTPFYSLEQQFGSYDFYRTAVDATGPLNKDKTLLYRATLQAVESDSFTEYVENNYLSIAPSLTWKPTDQTQIDFQFEYSNNEWTYPEGIPVVGGRPLDVPPHRLLEIKKPSDPEGTIENYFASINLEHHFNEDWKLRWVGLYNYQSTDWIGGGLVSIRRIDPETGAANSAFVVGNLGDRKSWFTSLNVDGKVEFLGIKNNFLLGFDYLNESIRDDIPFKSFTIDYNIYHPSDLYIPRPDSGEVGQYTDFAQAGNDWYGIYLQDQIDITDQLHLVLGGRFDHIESFYTPLGDPKIINRVDELTPRYGIVYLPVSWLSTYYQYQESIGISNGRSKDLSTAFPPQTAQQHEAGIKSEFFEGALSATLAFYHLTKQNILTTDPEQPSFQVPIGEARSQGIEFEVIGKVTEKLDLIASYTYTDTEVTKNNDGTEGNQLPNVPKSAGSLWGTYQLMNNFRVGAGVYVSGRRYGDNANTYELPGYARVDAMAAYKWRIGASALTAQVNINNLLDKDYYSRSDNRLAVFPGAPLTVLGSLRLEY